MNTYGRAEEIFAEKKSTSISRTGQSNRRTNPVITDEGDYGKTNLANLKTDPAGRTEIQLTRNVIPDRIGKCILNPKRAKT